MSGYTALRESAAWLDLSSRGRIQATGDDRLRFLHAMCSQDVEGLEPGQGTYAFFLNAQGRIQADSHIYVGTDHVLLDTEPERVQPLMEHLGKFIIMDDVALENVTSTLTAIALEGPDWEEVARRAFGDVPALPEPESHAETNAMLWLRSSVTGQPGVWLVAEAASQPELIGSLESAGARMATSDDAQLVRVENGKPRYSQDFFDSTLPQETQRLEAVSFTKGCYLGQEIVERVRSRGQVNRLLVRLQLEGKIPPPSSSAVLFEGTEVGRITSPVFSPRFNKVLGFALVRRAAAAPGTSVQVGALSGEVSSHQGVGTSPAPQGSLR